MNALIFFKEKARLTNNCTIPCQECRLSIWNNGKECPCNDLEREHPEVYVAIVQKWSEDCPQKTYKDVFLEAFPNAKLSKTGAPSGCLDNLGILTVTNCLKFKSCLECWNQAVK